MGWLYAPPHAYQLTYLTTHIMLHVRYSTMRSEATEGHAWWDVSFVTLSLGCGCSLSARKYVPYQALSRGYISL